MDYFLIEFRITLCIINVPPKSPEEWINKLSSQLGFVKLAPSVSSLVKFIFFNKFENCIRDLC